MALSEYFDHIHQLSLPNMHKADFLLILHNMFEHERAMRSAIWQCNSRADRYRNTTGILFVDMTSNELGAAIN